MTWPLRYWNLPLIYLKWMEVTNISNSRLIFSQSPTANDVVPSNSCLMNLYLDESRAPPLNCMPLYAFRMVSQKMKGNLHQREISL